MKYAILAVSLFVLLCTEALLGQERKHPVEVTYFKNVVTGQVGVYFLFELVPDREYSLEYTRDSETWIKFSHISTQGNTEDVYKAWAVINPCNGVWPRLIDLGPSTPLP